MIRKFLLNPRYFSISIFVLFYLFALWQTWFGSAFPCLFLALGPLGVILLEKVFNKLSKKWTFFDKLKKPFIWLFIIFFQIGIGGIFTIVLCTIVVRDITEPWAYQYAKGRTYCGDCIAHFPEKVPKAAKNVYLFQTISRFGSEELILAFDIDQNYIDNEIKKYKYQKIIEPYANRDKVKNLIPGNTIAPSMKEFEKVKLYIITLKPGSPHHFPIIYGIGTYNKTIMYFYSNPDY